MKFFIKTFGCQQNVADSERIEASFMARGMTKARGYKDANYVVINTCMIRHSAENRIYGLVENLGKFKKKPKIIVTGCIVGMAFRDKTGKYLKRLQTILPEVDEFMPIEEVGFDLEPIRKDKETAFIPISNGCNNFCTFCVVPFTRGREISRPYEEIIIEAKKAKKAGYKNIMLLGQNVNSYGADLIMSNVIARKSTNLQTTKQSKSKEIATLAILARNDNFTYKLNNKKLKPIFVKHLGRLRIPTFFPYLLEDIAKLGFDKIDFMSSNPWDFSDELINVIARNKNITRKLHLPVQSGDDNVLKRMNRWYTSEEYLNLVKKLKLKIKNLKLTTDIIVGFCGETDEEFKNTVKLCKKVGFNWAYVSMYSLRPMTAATKVMQDDIPYTVKKKRWLILDNLINRPHLKNVKIEK